VRQIHLHEKLIVRDVMWANAVEQPDNKR